MEMWHLNNALQTLEFIYLFIYLYSWIFPYADTWQSGVEQLNTFVHSSLDDTVLERESGRWEKDHFQHSIPERKSPTPWKPFNHEVCKWWQGGSGWLHFTKYMWRKIMRKVHEAWALLSEQLHTNKSQEG